MKQGVEYIVKLYNNIIKESLRQSRTFDESCIGALTKDKKKKILKDYLIKASKDDVAIFEQVASSDPKHLAQGYINLAKNYLKTNLEACKKKVTKKLTESQVENPGEFVDRFIDIAIMYEALSFAFDRDVAKETVSVIKEACKSRKKRKLNESTEILRKMGLLI